MLNDKIKGAAAGLLVGSMLTGGLAFAKTGSQMIEAAYSDIKIYMDGVRLDPKDADGKTVEPFIYDGTTYLPVRAVGEAIGKQVSWDGASKSVYLGEKPGDITYLYDVMKPYATCNGYTEYLSSEGKSFEMSGEKYTNGFTLQYSMYDGDDRYAVFNLNGNYSSMSLTVGHVDGSNVADTTVQFFVDDKVIKEIEIGGTDLAQKITIPLNNGLQLKIVNKRSNTKTGFGNIMLNK